MRTKPKMRLGRLGWPQPGPLALAASLAVAWALAEAASAHDVLTAYIHHRVGVVLGAEHVDVTVQLTFFEDGSQHERQHMDTNGDGQLSRTETEAYLHRLESNLTQAVTLHIAGQPVRLVPLREPELDLLGDIQVRRGHHRLTLFFFGSTPTNLTAGAELVVLDRLWPGTRAVTAMQVEGKDGAQLEAMAFDAAVLPPAQPGQARTFRARVVAPPARPRLASPPTAQR